VTKISASAQKRPKQSKMDPDAKRAQEVLVSLRQIIRAIDLHSRRLSIAWGMTISQIVALQAIRDLGEVTLGKLAKQMSLSLSTATTIL